MELTRAWTVDSVQPQEVQVGTRRNGDERIPVYEEVTVVRCVSKLERGDSESASFFVPDGGDVPKVGASVELNITFTNPEEGE